MTLAGVRTTQGVWLARQAANATTTEAPYPVPGRGLPNTTETYRWRMVAA